MKPYSDAKLAKIFAYKFGSIYKLYHTKITRKNQPKEDLDYLLCWLSGFDQQGLELQIESENDLEKFFKQCPKFNPNSSNITGMICGYRIEQIENELMRKVRYMDKLVDELSKGKTVAKILSKYDQTN